MRVLAVLFLIFFAAPAAASPSCMSHSEARGEFGAKMALYWHTADHCWDNRPVKRRVAARHRQAPAFKPPLPRSRPELDAAPAPVQSPPAEWDFASRFPSNMESFGRLELKR